MGLLNAKEGPFYFLIGEVWASFFFCSYFFSE